MHRTKCEDVFEGEDAVHSKGDLYLPRLEQQTDDQYAAMLRRARFYNAFGVTVHGMLGMVFRKDPVLECPDAQISDETLDILGNVDLEGTGLFEYSKNVLKQLAITGVCGTLIDVPEVEKMIADTEGSESAILSKLQAEQMNIRPYMTLYTSANIIRLKYAKVKNIKVLIMVVLREQYDAASDEFDEEVKYRYRVLRLDPETSVYSQQLYDEEEDSLTEEIFPKTLSTYKSIPFFLHGDINAVPPLYDLASTSIHHYMVKADHMHALHYIGLPTPCRSGVATPMPGQIAMTKALGPGQIWEFEDTAAQAWFLEMEGKGLEFIENELEKIEEHMAFLGASAIAPDSDVEETATKTKTKNASETSKLSSMADVVSQSCSEALLCLLQWIKNPQKVEMKLSKDYIPDSMTPQKLLALVSSWQSGAMSKRTLHKNLQKGEIQDSDRTFEDEEADIKKEEAESPKPITGNDPETDE
jgi:hypothetical protein